MSVASVLGAYYVYAPLLRVLLPCHKEKSLCLIVLVTDGGTLRV